MRWFGSFLGGRSLSRCSLAVMLAALIGLQAALAMAPSALAQAEDSPATGHAQVVAHGLVPMPGEELRWRVEQRSVLTGEEVAAATGFLLADQGNLIVLNQTTGNAFRLAPGMALLTRADERQEWLSGGIEAADYYAIDLIAAAGEPGAGEADPPRYVSETFPRPESGVGIALVRDVLGAGEATELPARPAPTLVLATAGTVEVAGEDGEPVSLAAGEAVARDGAVIIAATDGPATVVAALVETDRPTLPPEATAPVPGDEGSIEVVARVCPAGYDGGAEAGAAGFAAACPEALPGVWFSLIGAGMGATSITGGDGTVRFDGVAPGEYLLINDLPEDAARFQVFCLNATPGGEATTGQNRFDILMTAGAQVSCEWYVIPATDGGPQPGAIAVQALLCPSPAAPAERCSYTDEIFAGNLLLSGPGATQLSFANGQSHAVSHVWEGIPYGTYYFTLIDLADPGGYRLERIDGTAVVDVGVEAVVVDAVTPQVSIDFVYVPAGGETGTGDGSLMLSVYVCPEATSPLSECAVRPVEGEIAIEGPTGIWLDRANSDVSQRGDRRWEGLPAGTYNLAANLLTVEESGFGIARVDGADEYFEGVASVNIDAASPDVALAVVFAPGGPVAGP